MVHTMTFSKIAATIAVSFFLVSCADSPDNPSYVKTAVAERPQQPLSSGTVLSEKEKGADCIDLNARLLKLYVKMHSEKVAKREYRVKAEAYKKLLSQKGCRSISALKA